MLVVWYPEEATTEAGASAAASRPTAPDPIAASEGPILLVRGVERPRSA
jgi:hypothetical protein